MSILYLDCGMGAAGDMLSAALFELVEDKELFLEEINNIGLDDVKVEMLSSSKCGIVGTHMNVICAGEVEESIDVNHNKSEACEHVHNNSIEVEVLCHKHGHKHSEDEQHHHSHDHLEEGHYHSHEDVGVDHHHGHNHLEEGHHHSHNHLGNEHHHHHDHHHDGHAYGHHSHSSLDDIKNIVYSLKVSDNVKKDVLNVYMLIAEAESHAHGKEVSEIHFHEVGTKDAIADITICCMLMEKLAPERVIATPINVGRGRIKCAHGILPVPAPATAFILKNIPIYSNEVEGELCTPTGAALLKYFVDCFENMPTMSILKIGYGMGTKDFNTINCVRAVLGNKFENVSSDEKICHLNFNVDDMTAEQIAFANEKIFQAGAVEVFTTPVVMKKSRPGTLVNVICHEKCKKEVIYAIFKYTTTIGMREQIESRYVLDRKIENVNTAFGTIRKKISTGYGVSKWKYEYDDLALIAEETGMTISEVINSIK